MSVFTYPLRAQEFLQYLSLIRYAARVHKGLGWAIYDHKFRQKASLDKSLVWSQIDQHLWLTIFTVSPLALKEENPLFNTGPQSIRDFKIQRRRHDESRPEVKIPKMTTTAHDRDVNKPRPCSRRTCWRPFWRCWQTVSIWTYFDCELALFVCISKLNYPGYIPHVFVVVVSFQARKNVEFQTAVSKFLHSSFSELWLKKQNDLLYKSNVVPDYFLLVEDFPSMVKFIYRSWLLALRFILREFNSHTISRRNCVRF